MNSTTLLLVLFLGQPGPPATPTPRVFECTLPYLNGGGVVTLVSASEQDQIIEVTANNAYAYNVVLPKNSTSSFESPVYENLFTRITHGGPMSFKSAQPITAYTVLAQDAITVQCSDPTKPTKIFAGTARTGIAIVNITNAPIRVQLFQDDEQTPILTLTIAATGRTMGYLGEAFPVAGKHNYRLVADSYGIGLLAISYDSGVASAIPIGEYAVPAVE
jgi:hypothetical protein